MTGLARSAAFPVTAGASQSTDQGGGNRTGFAARIGADGRLVYASYLGGTGARGAGVGDQGNAVVVDAAGAADDLTAAPAAHPKPSRASVVNGRLTITRNNPTQGRMGLRAGRPGGERSAIGASARH